MKDKPKRGMSVKPKSNAKHLDAKQDKKMITKMVSKDCMK